MTMTRLRVLKHATGTDEAATVRRSTSDYDPLEGIETGVPEAVPAVVPVAPVTMTRLRVLKQ